jgi:Nif-specific regulatory protein
MKTSASREIKELALLFEISTKLSETLDLQTILQPILRMTTEHMGIRRGTVTILNRNSGEIVIEEAYGLRPEERAKGKYRPGEGITGKVFATGQPAVIPRISEEPLFLNRSGRSTASR